MGKVEDFINTLDGREDLVVTEVVSELLKLHNEEIGTSTAKINSLQTTLTDRDKAIAERDTEISKVKAANWDLVNQIPATESETPSAPQGDGIDQKRITLDDAFTQ